MFSRLARVSSVMINRNREMILYRSFLCIVGVASHRRYYSFLLQHAWHFWHSHSYFCDKKKLHSVDNMISEWWTALKINNWKKQNRTIDDYSDERLDNKHLKVFDSYDPSSHYYISDIFIFMIFWLIFLRLISFLVVVKLANHFLLNSKTVITFVMLTSICDWRMARIWRSQV